MKVLRWIPLIVIAGAIYHASSIPDLHLVNEGIIPIWLKKWVSQHYISIGDKGFFSYRLSLHPDFIAHKIGHIVAFGLLGVAGLFATGSKKWALLIVLLYASGDEIHQYFTPGRSSRFFDVVLDFTAGWAAIAIYLKLSRSFENKKEEY